MESTLMAGAELVTLFGNQLDEVSKARVGGVKVVGGEKVSYRDLAQLLLALAVVEVVTTGAGSLAEEQIKGRFRSRRELVLRATAAAPGFTGVVAAAATGGVEVKQLALAVIGREVASAETVLVSQAHASLEGTGAVTKAGSMGRKFGAALGMSSYDVDDRGAEHLHPEWERLRATWQGWRNAHPDLAKRLLADCKDALARATSSE